MKERMQENDSQHVKNEARAILHLKDYGVGPDNPQFEQIVNAFKGIEIRSNFEINAIADAIITLNSMGYIERWNPEAEKMFGLEESEVLGKKVGDTGIIPPELLDLHLKGAINVLSGNESKLAGKNLRFQAFNNKKERIDIQYRLSVWENENNKRQVTVSIRDITEQVRMEKELEEKSYRDELTGLYNRRAYEYEIEKFMKGRQKLSSAFIFDLTRLHFINNSLGLSVGDDFLKKFAETLTSEFRIEDFIARIGGDEFAVIANGMDEISAKAKVNSLNNALKSNDLGYSNFPLSMHSGLATTLDGNIVDAIKNADKQMLKSKKNNNNGKDSRD